MTPPENEAGELQVLAETEQVGVLYLRGEFDLTNAPKIIEEGKRLLADDKHVILDLSDATFIDSSVIHALLHVRAEAKKSGRVAVLQLGTAPIVERVIEITNIEQVLPRVSTRPEALDRIGEMQASA